MPISERFLGCHNAGKADICVRYETDRSHENDQTDLCCEALIEAAFQVRRRSIDIAFAHHRPPWGLMSPHLSRRVTG